MTNHHNSFITRRDWIAGTILLGAAGIARAADGALAVAALDHVNLHVPDVQKSADFYTKLFGTVVSRTASAPAKPGSPRSVIWFLRLGENVLAVSSTSGGEKAGIDHYCFAIDGLSAAALKPKLADIGDTAPASPNSLWLKDPDGYVIQITGGDKGDVPGAGVGAVLIQPENGRKRQPPFEANIISSLTLAVADAGKSAAYYRRVLGDSAGPGVNRLRAGHSNLVLGPAAGGVGFNVSIADFNPKAVTTKLRSLGITAKITHDKKSVSFVDPDGLTVTISA